LEPGADRVPDRRATLAGVLSQWAIGDAIDRTPYKRTASALAALVVVLGCLGIVFARTIPLQAVAQAAIGVAVTVFPATTSAFALGLVDGREVARRIARNESFTHGGNVVFAGLAAAVGLLAKVQFIFVAAAFFAAAMGWRRSPSARRM